MAATRRFLATAGVMLLVSSPLAAGAQQHIWDMQKDAPFWTKSANCPGPHYKSIFYRNSMGSQSRVCVDTDTIVRLSSGGRARFTSVHYSPASGFTSYMTKWYQADCSQGRWDSSIGYSVQNEGSSSYFPINGSPNWYEFIWEGRRPSRLSIGNGNWYAMTGVSKEDRFFCPSL
jgi:hypothetical protein